MARLCSYFLTQREEKKRKKGKKGDNHQISTEPR